MPTDLKVLDKTLNDADVAIKKQLNRFLGGIRSKELQTLHSTLKAAEKSINAMLDNLPEKEPTKEQKIAFYKAMRDVIDKGDEPVAKRAVVDIIKSLNAKDFTPKPDPKLENLMPHPDAGEQKKITRQIKNQDKALTEMRIPSRVTSPKPETTRPDPGRQPAQPAMDAETRKTLTAAVNNTLVKINNLRRQHKLNNPEEGGYLGYLYFREQGQNRTVPSDKGRPDLNDKYMAISKAALALRTDLLRGKQPTLKEVDDFHTALTAFEEQNKAEGQKAKDDLQAIKEGKDVKELKTVKLRRTEDLDKEGPAPAKVTPREHINNLVTFSKEVGDIIKTIRTDINKVKGLQDKAHREAGKMGREGKLVPAQPQNTEGPTGRPATPQGNVAPSQPGRQGGGN